MSKILVIDDSRMIRMLLTQTIEGLGYEALEASNGNEALTILEKEFSNIKLILLDWNMPEMNGLEFLQELRNNKTYEKILVMMVTTEGERVHVIKALKYGVANYLTKPFSPEDITTKIFECIGTPEEDLSFNDEISIPNIDDL